MNKNHILKKIIQSVITIILVLILNYFLFRIMPGNPLQMIMRNPKATPEAIAKTKALFGLDKPWYVQFGIYIKHLLQGDLGTSFLYKKPVGAVIASRVIPTVLLVG